MKKEKFNAKKEIENLKYHIKENTDFRREHEAIDHPFLFWIGLIGWICLIIFICAMVLLCFFSSSTQKEFCNSHGLIYDSEDEGFGYGHYCVDITDDILIERIPIIKIDDKWVFDIGEEK